MMKCVGRDLCLLIAGLCLLAGSGFAQDVDDVGTTTEPAQESVSPARTDPQQRSERLLLAISDPAYPVTPGDVYRVAYQYDRVITQDFVISSDVSADLGIFGNLDAGSMTLADLRREVGRRIATAYPGSTPVVTIVSVGLFQVLLRGEVCEATYKPVWGLSRLSSVLEGSLTDYSSTRNVQVTSRDGRTRSYDVFLARRSGVVAQDPLLKSGDTVTVQRRERAVELAGEVRRPGSYQLLAGEGLRDLVERYGDGLTTLADPKYLVIGRRQTEWIAQSLNVDISSGYGNAPELRDLDVVRVPIKARSLPVVYLEGAVLGTPATDTMTTVDAASFSGTVARSGQPQQESGKIAYQFGHGETLATAIQSLRQYIAPEADLANASITREGESNPIPVDLQRILYQRDPPQELAQLELRPFDRIVIPFGRFEVFVGGEVKQSRYVVVGSPTRLGAFVEGHLTPYSSIRDIRIETRGGASATYDLFRARRLGEREHDPYLKPGDSVWIGRRDRAVQLTGEVFRPDTYQLLPGEELEDLLNGYGEGVTPLADLSRVRVVRYATEEGVPARFIYLDLTKDPWAGVLLFDRDEVRVPTKVDDLPAVYFEGAVGHALVQQTADVEPSNVITYRFVPGERLSSAVAMAIPKAPAVADLAHSYIVRRGVDQPIAVNIEELLYAYDAAEDLVVEPGDRVVVPFRQFFVTVAGAVMLPGRYPYVPDRPVGYYVNLAGGTNPDRNSGGKVQITDAHGLPRSATDRIQPEDRIFAPTNSFFYHFNKYFPLVTTAVSIIASIVGIVSALR